MGNTILKVSDLKTHFFRNGKKIYAVDGIDFAIQEGETLGLVGESGCGKTVTARSIIGLVNGYPGIINGEICLSGENLLDGIDYSEDKSGLLKYQIWQKKYREKIKNIRGRKIGMVFQDPETSLDHLFGAKFQIAESALTYINDSNKAKFWQLKKSKQNWKMAYEIADDLLKELKLEIDNKTYPDAMSGGMRQRVAIASALAGKPLLLIADEPTTALDVTIQAKVLCLLKDIKEKTKLSILLIGHDMSVISALADKVVVMYNGRVMESGNSSDILNIDKKEKHPYTEALLKAVPNFTNKEKLFILPGSPPDPTSKLDGCRFFERCKAKCDLGIDIKEKCKTLEPEEFSLKADHKIRCWKWKTD